MVMTLVLYNTAVATVHPPLSSSSSFPRRNPTSVRRGLKLAPMALKSRNLALLTHASGADPMRPISVEEEAQNNGGEEEEKVLAEELESLEEEVMEGRDGGREPMDYDRRAHIFDLSSRVFQALKDRSETTKIKNSEKV